LRREENRITRRKTLGARTRTNNKLNPLMTPGPGFEPGPHWWEASAITTAPSLLPIKTSQEYLMKMLIAVIKTSLLEKTIMKFNKLKKILLETFISISK